MAMTTDHQQGEGFDKPEDPFVISKDGREIVRRMVQHEDDLRNQRLGYLLTLNGLLFAGLAFAWRAPHARSLVLVLAATGILIAVSTLSSMTLSDRAISYLRERAPLGRARLDGKNPTEEEEIESIPVALNELQIRQGWVLRLLQPWRALPVFLGVAWVAILVLGFKYLAS